MGNIPVWKYTPEQREMVRMRIIADAILKAGFSNLVKANSEHPWSVKTILEVRQVLEEFINTKFPDIET